MVPTYKIKLAKSTYEEVFIPFITSIHLKLPHIEKDDQVEVLIRRECVVVFLHQVFSRKIDGIEEIQSAFASREQVG